MANHLANCSTSDRPTLGPSSSVAYTSNLTSVFHRQKWIIKDQCPKFVKICSQILQFDVHPNAQSNLMNLYLKKTR